MTGTISGIRAPLGEKAISDLKLEISEKDKMPGLKPVIAFELFRTAKGAVLPGLKAHGFHPKTF
ncbi:MAG TPA: hypothetical protein VMH00_13935 [Candidatus Limnocylindrales bacterium]|nr:hypothetical protein [Candidatus Limnocylindrales bacterium]